MAVLVSKDLSESLEDVSHHPTTIRHAKGFKVTVLSPGLIPGNTF